MSRAAVNKADSDAVRSDNASARPLGLRVRRTLIVAFAALVVAVAAGAVADTTLAARSEARFSAALATAPGIAFQPEVTLGGFPFVTHAAAGRFTGATITARGVPVTGCSYPSAPVCFAEMGATLGEFRVPDGFDIGAADTLHTASVHAYSLVNSVNLGRLLGITDLTVNTPATPDRIGGGGPQFGNLERTTGVVLTGSVALPPDSAPDLGSVADPYTDPSASAYRGARTRVSVSVDLSVRDGRLHLQANGFYDGPEEHVVSAELAGDSAQHLRQAVLDRFTRTLGPLPMPWSLTPTGAHSKGSDIMVTAESGARDLRPDQF